MPKKKRIYIKSNKVQKLLHSGGIENAKKDFFELLRRAVSSDSKS